MISDELTAKHTARDRRSCMEAADLDAAIVRLQAREDEQNLGRSIGFAA